MSYKHDELMQDWLNGERYRWFNGLEDFDEFMDRYESSVDFRSVVASSINTARRNKWERDLAAIRRVPQTPNPGAGRYTPIQPGRGNRLRDDTIQDRYERKTE